MNNVYVCFLQVFAYDYCFWSIDDTEVSKFAGLACVIDSVHTDLPDLFIIKSECVYLMFMLMSQVRMWFFSVLERVFWTVLSRDTMHAYLHMAKQVHRHFLFLYYSYFYILFYLYFTYFLINNFYL